MVMSADINNFLQCLCIHTPKVMIRILKSVSKIVTNPNEDEISRKKLNNDVIVRHLYTCKGSIKIASYLYMQPVCQNAVFLSTNSSRINHTGSSNTGYAVHTVEFLYELYGKDAEIQRIRRV